MYGQNGCKNGSQTNQNGSQTNEMKLNQNEKGDKATKKEDNLEEKGGSARQNEQKIERSDTTMVTETTGNIALRTIPVYIKNGNRKLQMQALKRT